MPTYVYECSTCEKTFELEQRITEDPIKDCQCGSNGTVKRVIQPVGIAFKGSGFYVNGKKHGIWFFRNRKGKIVTKKYINGTVNAQTWIR
jgi:putative FmdB family regulatory protein